jgi:hypothetical protein
MILITNRRTDMGRELMRVPENFDWPMHRIWPGAMLGICNEMEYVAKELNSDERCELCRKWAKLSKLKISDYKCPELPWHKPPRGKWYQLWETTSEGSPISPAFEKPEELAKWLVDNNASTFGSETATYKQWLNFIKGSGWAPSAVMTKDGLESGVTGLNKIKEV